MNCINLQAAMKDLFDCDFFAEAFDPEGSEEHSKLAEAVLAQYRWNDVYEAFYKHLIAECCTEESVFNALNLFFYYCFDENPIPNPYELAGYILFRMDLIGTEESRRKYGDFVDGFLHNILEKSGHPRLVRDPYSYSWEDPKILAAKECWASTLSNQTL